MSSSSASATRNEYAKLRKDLLFHEKRMQLLLGSRIVEDIGDNLKEKSESRGLCAEDCSKAMKGFESGAMELHLSGKWSEVRISSMFGLEVPLTTIVGSSNFETPLAEGIAHVGALLTQMESMAQRIPEFRTNTNAAAADAASIVAGNKQQNSSTSNNGMSILSGGLSGGNGAADPSAAMNDPNTAIATLVPSEAMKKTASEAVTDVERFIKRANGIHWTPTDLRRITESIASKHTVLKELESLGAALRDAQYSASREQLRLEELRRADETATADGEMATEEAVIRERLEALERLIDILFFEAHTIDSSIDSNVKKRRSNMSVFINGAAVVQCIAREKRDVIKACESDIRKIDRCIQYEEAHSGHGDARRKIAASADNIAKIGEKQRALQQRLRDIYKEWSDTEQALENLGGQRSKAIMEHVELLDSARHAQSDFLEMSKYADQYKTNLEKTTEESHRAIEQLNLLERILLQQQTFETYDFKASAKRLATMQRRVAFDLNRALNEHQKCAEQMIRRLDAQSRAISEQIDLNECEAELRRDILDPATKKFVEKARDLARQREAIELESRRLTERVVAEHDHCMERIREVLPDDDIVDDSERISEEMMGRHEELLDMRQELVTPAEMAILDERLRVAREKQSTLAAVLQDTTRKSRILAIRNDIGRQRTAAEALTNAASTASPGVGGGGGGSPSSPKGLITDGTVPDDITIATDGPSAIGGGSGSSATATTTTNVSSNAVGAAANSRLSVSIAAPPPAVATRVVTGGGDLSNLVTDSRAASAAQNRSVHRSAAATFDTMDGGASSVAPPTTIVGGGAAAEEGTSTVLLVGRGGFVAGGAHEAANNSLLKTTKMIPPTASYSYGSPASAAGGGGGIGSSFVSSSSAAAGNSNATTASAAGIMTGPNGFGGIGGGVTSSLIASKAGGILVGGISGAIAAANASLAAAEAAAANANATSSLYHHNLRGNAQANHNHNGRPSSVSNANGDGTIKGAPSASAVDQTAESIDVSAVVKDGTGAADADTNMNATAGVSGDTNSNINNNTTTTNSGHVPFVTPTNPFAFNPNPDKITTSAALRAEALAEERMIEQERLVRLHGHNANLDIFGRGNGGGANNSSANHNGGGDDDDLGMNVEDEVKRRALIIRYRENEERALRMRVKARAIGGGAAKASSASAVAAADANNASVNNVSVGDVDLGV